MTKATYKQNQFSVNQYFSEMCSKGNLKKIKEFMSSEEKGVKVDQDGMNQALIHAFMFNKLKVIKYLLTSEDLTIKSNVHHKNDILFRLAYDDNNKEILDYLIDELKIEQTTRIKEEIKNIPNTAVEKKFMIRDLYKDLPINQEKNKKLKI